MQMQTGGFTLSPAATVYAGGAGLQSSVATLNAYLKKYHGFELRRAASPKASVSLVLDSKAGNVSGAYQLWVSNQGIEVRGYDAAGVYYGVQTLLQLLPHPKTKALLVQVPAVQITDAPRFPYRGMMLDVARHFQPISFVKQTIDQLAMLKMNVFHWHLTEDQGWRIEIKKYPKLTEVGAWRDGTIVGRYPGAANDNQRYGGFYTQEEIKEVVRYAAERHITIVPEIEMPGHSGAAIAAYPFLSCFPQEETVIPKHPSEAAKAKKGKKVMESWGVYEDVFAPTEETFKFLEDVIDEVAALFPGKYIHIGGDECPKEAWKRSAFCQQLIKEKGLKDEHGLQSYFIQRMEKYINSKGKQIIGWDEILEGGLAPNATVMSWRGEEGGIEAAKQQHDVIMTPTSHCYLDYSQSKNEDSVTIGGYISLEKIYGYEPIPVELRGTPAARFVQGTQANVWTEYMRYPAKVQYMIYPRLAALAEVAWTQPDQKNWDRFQQKIPTLFQRLSRQNISYSKAFYDIDASIERRPDGSGVQWLLQTKNAQGKLMIAAPGKAAVPYTGPVAIDQSGTWTASLLEGNKTVSTVSQVFNLHKAVGKTIQVQTAPSPKYPGNGGVQGLINGAASQRGMNSTEWCGWEGKDLEAVIDLGSAQQLSTVAVHSIESQGSWIYRPAIVQVLLSEDGVTYREAGSKQLSAPVDDQFRVVGFAFAAAKARYVKVIARHFGIIPAGMPGASNHAWMFIDEIVVN